MLLNCEIHKIKVHKLPSIILIKVKLRYFFVFFFIGYTLVSQKKLTTS